MSEKRNIVLITLDSVRADHCSFMGYHRETTPNIDRMARKGLYFENAIAPSVGTPASLVGIFTGEHTHVNANETRAEPWRKEISKRKTLAQVLSKAGYTTVAFNPNAFVSSYFGFNKGFEYFEDFLSCKENKNILKKLHHRFFKNIAKGGKKGVSFILRNLIMFISKEEIFRNWGSYYELILNKIEKVHDPFFLWILIIDTHHPYLAPKKFRKYSNLFTMWYSNWKVQKVKWKAKLSEKERKWLMGAYDDSIYYADAFINRIWNDLKNRDPIFVIHADHGEGFCEHGFYGHPLYLYEELVHVPLIFYNIDVKDKIEEPVSLLGLAPTLLELIGMENVFPSKSLLSERNKWVISKVFDNDKMKIAIRMKNWKFIMGQKGDGELFNLKEDPQEQENVINVYPEIAKEPRKIVNNHIRHESEISKIRKVAKLLKKV